MGHPSTSTTQSWRVCATALANHSGGSILGLILLICITICEVLAAWANVPSRSLLSLIAHPLTRSLSLFLTFSRPHRNWHVAEFDMAGLNVEPLLVPIAARLN